MSTAFVIAEKNKSADKITGYLGFTGSLFYIIGGTVLHGILMSVIIAFLLPILLGGTSATPITGIIALLWPIIKTGIIAIIIITILTFIPLIGRFVANSPDIQVFLVGVISFRLLAGYPIKQILSKANIHGNVYPGFWASIGFLIIAIILTRLIMLAFVLVYARFEGTAIGDLMEMVLGYVFGVLAGVIPVLMYSSYVRLSIQKLIGG